MSCVRHARRRTPSGRTVGHSGQLAARSGARLYWPGMADLTPHAESGVDTARSRAEGQPG